MKTVLIFLMAFFATPALAEGDPVEVWLGLGGCERARVPFRLTVMDDGKVRMSGQFAPQMMDGAIGPDAVSLAFSSWLSRRAPSRQPQFNLSGSADLEAGLLVGTMQGMKECETVVAMRVDLPPAAAQPGLLAKVAGVTNARGILTDADCEAYFGWLAEAGTPSDGPRSGPNINPALGDHARMQAVLGTDIYRWRAEHWVEVRKLAECRRLFSRSDNPRHAEVMAAAQGRGKLIPTPLDQDPDPAASSQWIYAFLMAHADDFTKLEDLLRLAVISPDAVLAGPGGSGPAPVAEPDETGQSWIGVLSCGRGDRFLNVTQTGAEVTLETGPGLFGGVEPALVSMSGRVGDGAFVLDPQEWIVKPSSILGAPEAIGLRGETSGGMAEIQGTIQGSADCTGFRALKQVPPPLTLNAEGLLFQSRIDLDGCVSLAEWLATGSEDRIGRIPFNPLILDDDSIVALFGKPLAHWDAPDVGRFRRMTSECRVALGASAQIAHQTLLTSIPDWTVAPLSTTREGGSSDGWYHYDLIRVMGADAERGRGLQLDEVRAMPAEFGSLAAIDQLVVATANAEGRLRYLRQSSVDAHLHDMTEARKALALRIAESELAALDAHPATLDGLLQAEQDAERSALQFEEHQAPEAAQAVASGFRSFAEARGLLLWNSYLPEFAARLEGLSGADYRHFGEIEQIRDIETTLMRFARPQSAAATRAAYDAHVDIMEATVETLVAASLPGLLAYLDALPLSEAGLAAANDLLATTFPRQTPSPARDALNAAVAAKQAAYNPAGYLRPDVIYGFTRETWDDVEFQGLENLAYIATLLKQLRDSCPMTIQIGDAAMSSYVLRGATDATERVLRGEVQSRSEAQRAVLLMANTLFNQPGCEVDFFGNQTSNCTSPEDHAAAVQLFMTSGPALSDMRRVLAQGCSAPEVAALGRGASRFVELRPYSATLPATPLPRLAAFLQQ
ncbi:hypothetical protein [Sinisalibacter aestuarii]|uniref:Uncharacterized protein n=1 Tax=Sinisalibacter aestuarii TaxID=2949426 RepID=A0ABQ5LQ17_9RHOB|nr:hypothetical protein [Sinisalibacter aestuarii]GKY87094.1 hypothetical protein STA1M1_09630 [Sinisalibacter aestuarii]